MRDWKDILFVNLITDVKDWSIFSDFKDWHIRDWCIINTNEGWIQETDPYLSTSKTDTVTIDTYSALIKDGYKRLTHIECGPRTDLTKVFLNI